MCACAEPIRSEIRPIKRAMTSKKKRTDSDALGKEPAKKHARSASLLEEVISGGQTGADRAALEAARECGVQTGGFAPVGFVTTKGADPTLGSVFRLREIAAPNGTNPYAFRSMVNVDASDATVAFRCRASVGTDATIEYARSGRWGSKRKRVVPQQAHRPCLVIVNIDDTDAAAVSIAAFVRECGVRVLNVCGHRNDETAGRSEYTAQVRLVMVAALTLLRQGDNSSSASTSAE